MSAAPSLPTPGPAPATAPTPFSLRLAVGLLGILLASMVAGLNGRVPGLVLADLRGAMGLSMDSASWLTTAYSAGELSAMPFATWFAITYSLRRFHLSMLFITLGISAVLPLVQNLHVLLVLRLFHGMLGGALIPILMMASLRFLPTPIRLHGLAIFSLVATFSPNIALWLAAVWVDRLEDWRWVYWHVIPLGLLAAGMVAWGIPKLPVALPRLKQANWLGLILGMPGLMLMVVCLDQGVRLDWLNSPIIAASLLLGSVLCALFLISEWRHPTPFVRLQLLGRRNIGVNLMCCAVLLMAMASSAALPPIFLGITHGFLMEQSYPLGLLIGLPQLIIAPCVAILLYQRWVDARHVFALGLVLMSAACWMASDLTQEWMVRQFIGPTLLQAVGQPLAMIALLFLTTSAVQPMEGPFLAGLFNIVRVVSATAGGAVINQMLSVRGHFHTEALFDAAGSALPRLGLPDSSFDTLGNAIAEQATVLATADTYRLFGVLVLLLIPVVLWLNYIPPPMVERKAPAALAPATS